VFNIVFTKTEDTSKAFSPFYPVVSRIAEIKILNRSHNETGYLEHHSS
jgi:hypothetical protein